MSKGNYFVLCKNCTNKIDLGSENPLKKHLAEPSLTLNVKCGKCDNINHFHLEKDLHLFGEFYKTK